jgi:hypothetical protein
MLSGMHGACLILAIDQRIPRIGRHQKSRNSVRGRRKMAAWDNEYMKQILTGFFHA